MKLLKKIDIMFKNLYCWAFSKKSSTWEWWELWETRVRKYLTHVQRFSILQLFVEHLFSITGRSLWMYMYHILNIASASWFSATYFPLLHYHLIFRFMNFSLSCIIFRWPLRPFIHLLMFISQMRTIVLLFGIKFITTV